MRVTKILTVGILLITMLSMGCSTLVRVKQRAESQSAPSSINFEGSTLKMSGEIWKFKSAPHRLYGRISVNTVNGTFPANLRVYHMQIMDGIGKVSRLLNIRKNQIGNWQLTTRERHRDLRLKLDNFNEGFEINFDLDYKMDSTDDFHLSVSLTDESFSRYILTVQDLKLSWKE